MYVSRAPELISWFHIGLLLQPLLLVGLFMTDETFVLTKVRSARWLIAFTIWIAICVPTSAWPGGSFAALVKTAQSLLFVAFILAFVQSFREVTRTLATVGFASGAIAIFSFISSSDIANRQGLGGSASLADPNFFALYLLVGVVFLCFTAYQGRGVVRLCSLALIPLNLVGILRSGSRAGFITLAVGLIMFLIYGSTRQRTFILSVCLVGAVGAAVLLPHDIIVRFTDILGPTAFRAFTTGKRTQVEEQNLAQITVAESSSEARMYLLRRSLILTAKNPILGVGPDQFQTAEAADAASRGESGAWHYTHNTYTQISSECGIPGLIMFGGALIWAYSGLSQMRRRGPTRLIRQTALFFQVSYFMLVVGAFFLSMGYGGLPFVMIGLSETFKRAVNRQAREARTLNSQPELQAIS
jgi:O-antigen ligase